MFDPWDTNRGGEVTLEQATALCAKRRAASQGSDPRPVTPAQPAPITRAPEPPAPPDLTVTDTHRHRDLPIRVFLPADPKAAPVVLFSHGLGGNRQASGYLGRRWAARGYVAVFLQHPGSDDGVWKNQPLRERNRAMRDASSGANFLLRVKDVTAVLDQLERWERTTNPPLARRLDLTRVGMSGHSFGKVTIPWLLMTGTKVEPAWARIQSRTPCRSSRLKALEVSTRSATTGRRFL
ncbi:MAG TPA: hypothetical protein PKM73_14815 [Verrucomicrobiota bacterium]|nr:hypothetical protein [Verrucomicrobiota bacterium]HNU52894.1 hypothetical protein [Verrucomicrobiota bacterium]